MSESTDTLPTRTSTLRWPVVIPSVLLIGLLLAFCGFAPATAANWFVVGQTWVGHHFAWLYILATALFLVVLIAIACSSFGNIRLGPDDSVPEFGFTSWLSMLFAAGMGIGLMYFGIGEPMQHFVSPRLGDPGGTATAAREAMTTTFFHWGLHAWAIYGIVGLVLAYFGFRYNLPLTIRSGLYPMLRERIHGPIGHAVDTFALCGTVFGLTTTLGYGVLQISAGLHDMIGWQTDSKVFQVGLIVCVMTLACISAVSGLGKGLRRLSELNLALAVLLMLFVLAVGPTLYLLGAFSDNLGNYLSNVVSMTFETYTYDKLKDPGWFDNWTLLYWAWWISWSPFVGMFIARISRGRTIREFIIGVLVVPSLFNFLWMTVFGNSAMWLDMHGAAGELSAAAANVDALLFDFLGRLPWPEVTTGLAVLLIFVFFVTSADSGTFVIDSIASGGQDGSPIWQRVFWAALLTVTAALLLVTGGLEALRAMTIISALPFTVVMLALCYGLWRGLQADRKHFSEDLAPATSFWTGQHWRKRLELILRQPTARDVTRFLKETAMPALTEVADALRAQGVEVDVTRNEEDGSVVLNVPRENLRNFVYGVRPVRVELPSYIISEAALPAQKRTHSYQPVTFFEDGRVGYNVEYLSQQELIADVLKQYERYLTLVQDERTHLLNAAPGHST